MRWKRINPSVICISQRFLKILKKKTIPAWFVHFSFKIFRKLCLIHTTTEEKLKSFCHPSIIKARCWYPACAIACFIVQISAGDHVPHNLWKLLIILITRPISNLKIYNLDKSKDFFIINSWSENGHGLQLKSELWNRLWHKLDINTLP